jgi:hypothetical protein
MFVPFVMYFKQNRRPVIRSLYRWRVPTASNAPSRRGTVWKWNCE